MALPNGFVDLHQAYQTPKGSFVNVIGIAVDYMKPTKPANTNDYMFTFKLLDTQFRDSVLSLQGLHGFTVRFFRASEKEFPQIQNVGDAVLLRNVKIMSRLGSMVAISNYQTETTVFPAASIPPPDFKIAYQRGGLTCLGIPLHTQRLSLQEQEYVIQLKENLRDVVDSLPQRAISGGTTNNAPLPLNVQNGLTAMTTHSAEDMAIPTGPAAMKKRPGEDLQAPTLSKKAKPKDKFRLIRDLKHFDFGDLCVEVVRKYANSGFGTCQLYVTDYTENKAMFYYSPPEDAEEHERDGDRFNYTEGGPKKLFPGPYGQLVLQVFLKEPHARFATHKVKEGDLLWLQNVNSKQKQQYLEGEMWPDQHNPDKLKIFKVNDLTESRVTDMLSRKEAYWRKRKLKFPDPGGEQQLVKPKLTKNERKKLRKLEREAAEQKKEAKRLARQEQTNGNSRPDSNRHVRCSFGDVPISSVQNIRDPTNARHASTIPGAEGTEYILPFVNAKYRARVRVVDFYPKKLEDFAYLAAPQADNDTIFDDYPLTLLEQTANFAWAFSLQLENASTKLQTSSTAHESNRIWANVHHQEAQFLFGNGVDDPSDLRDNPRLLAQLREKLCILWGNVEERQTGGNEEPISNLPFECCIQEYGIHVDDEDGSSISTEDDETFGFKRMYSMFGVTIS